MMTRRRVAIAAVLVIAAAPSAMAHAILIDSDPAPRAMLRPGAATVTMRFNSRIDRERSRLTLIAADHSQTRLEIGPSGPDNQMTTVATLPPGDVVIRWQVLAVDGHITRGDLPFTVAP